MGGGAGAPAYLTCCYMSHPVAVGPYAYALRGYGSGIADPSIAVIDTSNPFAPTISVVLEDEIALPGTPGETSTAKRARP